MTKKERVEDLGIICQKIDHLLEDRVWDHLESKHQFEEWVRHHFPTFKLSDAQEKENINEEKLYEMHMKMRWLHEEILNIWSIARGEDEIYS